MISGSLQCRARLEFRHDDATGRTVLHRRLAGGLCHVGKPYWDGRCLTLQLVNPTAGIFSGDRFGLEVEVDEGAQVAIECPSATRFHTMLAGGHATLEQSFDIADGASLDFWPDWTIPQRGSSVSQETTIRLAPHGRLAFLDLLAPGRVAHGESHDYRSYTTSLRIDRAGIPLAIERMELDAISADGWPLAVNGWSTTFYAGLWLVDSALNVTSLSETIADLELGLSSDEVRIGISQLADDSFVFRLLSARALLLRQAIEELRSALAVHSSILSRTSRKL